MSSFSALRNKIYFENWENCRKINALPKPFPIIKTNIYVVYNYTLKPSIPSPAPCHRCTNWQTHSLSALREHSPWKRPPCLWAPRQQFKECSRYSVGSSGHSKADARSAIIITKASSELVNSHHARCRYSQEQKGHSQKRLQTGKLFLRNSSLSTWLILHGHFFSWQPGVVFYDSLLDSSTSVLEETDGHVMRVQLVLYYFPEAYF